MNSDNHLKPPPARSASGSASGSGSGPYRKPRPNEREDGGLPVESGLSRLKRQMAAEGMFDPSQLQERAKAKFYRTLDQRSHMVSKEAVLENEAMLVEFCGTKHITTWAQHPGFSAWFLDEDVTMDYVISLRDQAVRTIHATLLDEDTPAKDRLKAADMVLQLAGMYPSKESTVKFLDERLNALTEAETDREIKQLKSRLATDGDPT